MKFLKLYFFTASFFLFGTFANAQSDYYWVGNGVDNLWGNPSNWSISSGGAGGAGIPSDADNVIFDNLSLNDCDVDVDFSIDNFTIDGYAGTIKFLMPSTMTVNGAFSMNSGTFDGEGNVGGTGVSAIDLEVFGAFSITSSANFITPSGFLTLRGSIASGGTFTSNIGTTTIFMTAGKTLPGGWTFNDLEISTEQTSGSARTLTISDTITVNGNLSLTSSGSRGVNIGTSPIDLKGNLDISSYSSATVFGTQSGSIRLNGTSSQSITGTATSGGQLPSIVINQSSTGGVSMSGVLNIAGSWTYTSSGSGSVSPGASTVNFVGTAIKNIDGESLGNVRMPFNTLTTTGGAVTLTGGLRVDGSCTINNVVNIQSNTVELRGSFTNGGTLNANNSSFLLTGTNSQSIDFSNGVADTIANLSVNKTSNTASITDQIYITGLLTSTSGTLQTNGNVILASSSTGTAQIATVTGTISGNMTVQRFIPSRVNRRWRFLAAPITAASGVSIRNGWQSQIFITGSGTGSGPVGTANYNSNGFDWTLANSPSMYTYNESKTLTPDFNLRWESPATTTGVNLTAGTGYRIFIRGDRSNAAVLSGGISSQASVTLAATGTVQIGNLNVPITCSNGCGTDDGWNLIGNPYPATIDWNTLQTANSGVINNTYTTFDPNSGASGAYVSWNGTTGDAGRYISSGQAFWVKSTSVSANLSFTESQKASSEVGSNRFKTSALTNHMVITFSGNGFNNKAFVHQNTTGTYGNDNYDAVKFGYGSYQIATFVPGYNTRYDINNLPIYGTKATDTIEVEVNVPTSAANYQLSFADINTFNSNLKVYLQDKLLNTIQDLSTANTYSFATNGTAGSTGNRFRVLITNQTNPLPVVFTALEASLNNNTTDLKWSTLSEKNNAKFIVERSTDMVNFTEIGLVKAVGNSNVKNTYTFTDVKPEAYTTNYYRIKQVDFDGKHAYSNIASITTDIKGNGTNTTEDITTAAKVFPIPTKDVLNIEQLEGTVLTYTVVDVFGSEVLNGTTEITENGSSIRVSALANGIYFLVAKTDNGQLTKTRFIVE